MHLIPLSERTYPLAKERAAKIERQAEDWAAAKLNTDDVIEQRRLQRKIMQIAQQLLSLNKRIWEYERIQAGENRS